ncbi:hypothetical protein BDA99DRAFT_549271 [Phascolomyces articulosus]|uniref:Antagonist of mitotic exit network protein 1 n=1 Tax=Phascolomyces articulosus TaxID=60185 RepID=A0AAD5P906_9FUNG|nr:hypothetical protein BDA99DRAFT_549271 [Phascolomyces articulosus]
MTLIDFENNDITNDKGIVLKAFSSIDKLKTHFALGLPEIVTIILNHVAYSINYSKNSNNTSNYNSGSSKDCIGISKEALSQLYQCLFVNQLWQDCTTRIMYRNLQFNEDKSEYDAFVKFASTFADAPVLQQQRPNIPTYCTPASLAVANPCDNNNSNNNNDEQLHSYQRMPSLSSTSTSTSTSTSSSSLSSSEYRMPNSKSQYFYTMTPPYHYDYNNDLIFIDERPYRLDMYRRTLRTLTLRKIKEFTSVTQSLQQVGKHAFRLERLELYICDSITDDSVLPFLTHGNLTHLTLAGCYQVTDAVITQAAESCRNLVLLDVRACGLISDTSITEIALKCPKLRHLNVGRVRDRERISTASINLIAQHTQIAVLGLAGCDITDECMLLLAHHRNKELERISVNNCRRLTNKSVHAFVKQCVNLAVFEMKECHLVDDWEAVAEMVKRKVLLTLCEQQNRDCVEWAKAHGRTLHVRAPLK